MASKSKQFKKLDEVSNPKRNKYGQRDKKYDNRTNKPKVKQQDFKPKAIVQDKKGVKPQEPKKEVYTKQKLPEEEKLVMTYNRFKRYKSLLRVFKIDPQAKTTVTLVLPDVVTLHRLTLNANTNVYYLQSLDGKQKFELTGGHYHKDKNVMFVVKDENDNKFDVHCEVYLLYKKITSTVQTQQVTKQQGVKHASTNKTNNSAATKQGRTGQRR